jgi:hypothetical protein
MTSLRAIKLDILRSCYDDYTGLWEVIRIVQRHAPGLDGRELMGTTLRCVKDLIETDLVELGAPTPNGREFRRWNLQADESLSRIEREWSAVKAARNRHPTIGEIVWLTTSARGDQLLLDR